jgi:hypothetical protein
VDQTYIAAAVVTGNVTLKPLTEVTGVRRGRFGEYVVSTREIDRFGREVSRAEIGCDQLHLAAGVLGTTQILLRARDKGTLSDLSQEVGRGYGNNGDIMVSHMLAPGDPAGTQQSLMGMINLDGRNDPDNPVYASMFSLPLPMETLALGYYVMVRTGDRADITYDRAKDSVAINWSQGYTDHPAAEGAAGFRQGDRRQRRGLLRRPLRGNRVRAQHRSPPGRGGAGHGHRLLRPRQRIRQAVRQRRVAAARVPGLQPVHVHHRARQTQHRMDPAGAQVITR